MDYETSIPREDGLNISSAFHCHVPREKDVPLEEKKALLTDWSKKTEQMGKLLGYFEEQMSQSLMTESNQLIDQLLTFVKKQKVSISHEKPLGYIPTALTHLGWRMTDRDAIYDFLEERLYQENKLITSIVRMEPCHTTDIESMKRQIVTGILADESIRKQLGLNGMKKGQENRLPYPVLAEAYHKIVTSNQRSQGSTLSPVIIMIEEVERANSEALGYLFPLLRASLHYLPVLVILGSCTTSVCLNHLVPSKALDCLMVQTISSRSPKLILESILSGLLILKPLFSFKFGPNAIKLLEDNFFFYNYSLEKLLSVVKLMVMNHFRDNDLSVLSTTSSQELNDVLKYMSQKDLTTLKSLVKTLPSITGQNIPDSDAEFKMFLKKCLFTIDRLHSEYLSCIESLVMLTSDFNVDSSTASLISYVIQALSTQEDITVTDDFKDTVKTILSLSLDDFIKRLDFCFNNIPHPVMNGKHEQEGSDDASQSLSTDVYQLISKKCQELKDLDKEMNLEMQASVVKNNSLTDSSNLNNKALFNNNNHIDFKGLKSRQEWKERLKEKIVSSSPTNKRTSCSKFEQFKNDFVRDLKSLLKQMKSPLLLPLNEIVYFDDSASVASNYYPCLRNDILRSLRTPFLEKSDKTVDICKVYQSLSGLPAAVSLSHLYHGFPESSKKSKKGVSPKKRGRRSKKKQDSDDEDKESKGKESVMEKTQFFTLINDMEYIGLILRDRKKTGRLTKLVWE